MNKRIFLLSTLISLILLNSCDKNSDDESSKGYIEITIDGEKYKQENPMVNAGFADLNGGCNAKDYNLAYVGTVETSSFYFDMYLNHYYYLSDFKASKPGQYSVKKYNLFTTKLCDLEVAVLFEDNTKDNVNTSLLSGGKHIVTSIKQKSSSDTEMIYQVNGSFSCSFRNASNKTIPLEGIYQIDVYVVR